MDALEGDNDPGELTEVPKAGRSDDWRSVAMAGIKAARASAQPGLYSILKSFSDVSAAAEKPAVEVGEEFAPGMTRLLALLALSRTVEMAGRNTAGNLDLAFWHADSGEFEGEAARLAWARLG